MWTRSVLAAATHLSLILSLGLTLAVTSSAPADDVDTSVTGGTSAPVLVRAANGLPVQPRGRIERARRVELDDGVLGTLEPGLVVRLEVFADVTPDVRIERVRQTAAQLVISGTPADDPRGSFMMVHRGGIGSAELRLPDQGIFRVRGTGDGDYIAQQLEQDPEQPDCATGPEQFVQSAGGGGVAGSCDDGSVVDVIILYSTVARQEAGGAGPIESDIALSIEATNQAYASSQINTQVNLLLTQEIAYTENGSYSEHLYRLSDPTDGVMDEAHILREDLGADLVCLYVDDGQYCGIAWLMGNVSPQFEDNGFSIVTWYCSSLVLGHEFGHNMGCHHDHDNASSSPAFSYSYGHRFNGDSGSLWRTVMSYSPGTRVGHFSNPNVLFDGQPTGVPQGEPLPADNAQSIEQTKSTVANFRCSAPPTELTVITDAEAFAAMLADPTIVDFDGVPAGQIIERPAGYSWTQLEAAVPMLQVDREANVAGGPFVSDFVASVNDDSSVAFDLPPGQDAVGGLWFHGANAQAGFDGLFRITLADGTVNNYLLADIGTGQGLTEPGFVGFVSACDTIRSIEFEAVTAISSTTAMADDVVFGFTGFDCPGNDVCTDAITVGDGSWPLSTVNATTDGTNDNLCGGSGDNGIEADVWFKYVAPCDKPVTVSVCDVSFDARIAVYQSFCPTLINQAMACATDGCGSGASVTFDVEGGTTYRIRVGSRDGAQGVGTLTIDSEECIPAPINDDCGDSQTISAGSWGFTTVGATTDGPAEGGCGYAGAPQIERDVWFRFVAPCDETITLELCEVDFETRMAVYPGPCPGEPGEALDCSEGACVTSSRISFPATAGTLYRLRVGAATNQTGDGTVTLTCGDPPPDCPADVDGSGFVDVDDLVTVIIGEDPNADVNQDGVIDVDDVVEVILSWGPCG